jgi:hypothetical protein
MRPGRNVSASLPRCATDVVAADLRDAGRRVEHAAQHTFGAKLAPAPRSKRRG